MLGKWLGIILKDGKINEDKHFTNYFLTHPNRNSHKPFPELTNPFDLLPFVTRVLMDAGLKGSYYSIARIVDSLSAKHNLIGIINSKFFIRRSLGLGGCNNKHMFVKTD
jgi:hypothetical protein